MLTCLNKLDAGTDEKVMLVARDEQSCLVVSYKEIKACVAGAFEYVKICFRVKPLLTTFLIVNCGVRSVVPDDMCKRTRKHVESEKDSENVEKSVSLVVFSLTFCESE